MTQAAALAHFLSGALLLCTFALLAQRRLSAMIALYRAEALILCAAAFAESIAQHSADLFLCGIITFSFKVVLLPQALRRILHRFNLTGAVETTLPIGVSMVLGLALTGIAVLAVPLDPANATAHLDLALALAVTLLGFLAMTTRRNALAQAIGFLSAENGLMLAAISLPGMKFTAPLAIALLLLVALLLLGVFIFRLREDLERPDPAALEEIEGQAR
jgi:hydrogenase-4 component E